MIVFAPPGIAGPGTAELQLHTPRPGMVGPGIAELQLGIPRPGMVGPGIAELQLGIRPVNHYPTTLE